MAREEILDHFKDFHPKFLRLLDLPADSPPMRWQLRAMPLLPTWIRGRAALLGDSAHATLPLLGQGAAMAFEEAATLGCLLPLGTTKEDIPARLEAYQTLSKERGEYVNVESLAQASVPEKRGSYLKCEPHSFLSRHLLMYSSLAPEMQARMLEYDSVKVANEYYDAHFRS